jgi:hypothetical protein
MNLFFRKTRIKKNTLLLCVVTGLLLSSFHFHSESNVLEHDNCVACHQQGTITSPTKVFEIKLLFIPNDSVNRYSTVVTQVEDFSLNDSRAPPFFFL